MTDFSSIFLWWLTILLVSITVLPITLNLFRKFVDRGYIFSKVLGILLTSYLIWILGSLHILPFTKISIILVLIAASLVSIFISNKKNQTDKVRFPVGWAILEEILFFLALLF